MERISQAFLNFVNSKYGIDTNIVLARTDEKFGDFSTNIAMQIAGRLGHNPRQVAEEIVANISDDLITDIQVAGPGFINITLSESGLIQFAESEPQRIYANQSVVIETNNPNPFKAMHVGHAFNAILADNVANLLEAGGANVFRVSYHGDVGLHVGKSMYSLLAYVDGDASKLDQIAENERNAFMSKMYATGSTAYKSDETAKLEIDELAKQSFTREDPLFAKVYDTCKDWSFEQIDRDVARLGNKPTERRFLESDAELRGVKIVKDNTPGVFIESDGAIVFEGSKYGAFDNAFVSKRGTGLYASRDLGLIQLKNEYYHPQKSYIVTAEEQRDYFKGVIVAAGLCMPDLKDVTVNISTGTVLLPSGKMSSRDGAVVDIALLFEQVSEAIKSRGGTSDDISIAAVLRYQFLQVRIGGDVVFDVDNASSVQGNSGPYLQYAHARARSIIAKVGSESVGELVDLQPDERSLLRKIGEYNEVVDRAVAELLPHYVCNYLYELSQGFNKFYEHNRVAGDERESVRLKLVMLYADTIKSGLGLLGIHAPDKM
ncbi:arginine--tRNA ligase [Candidatus Saccharibacteria bacterium]|nr:arginine--tRNA ligase [Candidatus Saccharibacteria bacterium]